MYERPGSSESPSLPTTLPAFDGGLRTSFASLQGGSRMKDCAPPPLFSLCFMCAPSQSLFDVAVDRFANVKRHAAAHVRCDGLQLGDLILTQI
jgi:hypothetical protein